METRRVAASRTELGGLKGNLTTWSELSTFCCLVHILQESGDINLWGSRIISQPFKVTQQRCGDNPNLCFVFYHVG